jgi:hypothetical protein
MNKKYIVQLTSDQRAMLEQLTRTGTTAASVQRHARILLKADTAVTDPGWDDAAVAAAVEVSVPTVERVPRNLSGRVLRLPWDASPPHAPPNASWMAGRKPNWSPWPVVRHRTRRSAGHWRYWPTNWSRSK